MLGIDLGTRRIGPAVATRVRDRVPRAPNRGETIEADAVAIGRVAGSRACPSRPSVFGGGEGQEGAMVVAARDWASAIAVRLALLVALRDERLSSSRPSGVLGWMPRGRSGGALTWTQWNAFRARSIGGGKASSSRTSWTRGGRGSPWCPPRQWPRVRGPDGNAKEQR